MPFASAEKAKAYRKDWKAKNRAKVLAQKTRARRRKGIQPHLSFGKEQERCRRVGKPITPALDIQLMELPTTVQSVCAWRRTRYSKSHKERSKNDPVRLAARRVRDRAYRLRRVAQDPEWRAREGERKKRERAAVLNDPIRREAYLGRARVHYRNYFTKLKTDTERHAKYLAKRRERYAARRESDPKNGLIKHRAYMARLRTDPDRLARYLERTRRWRKNRRADPVRHERCLANTRRWRENLRADPVRHEQHLANARQRYAERRARSTTTTRPTRRSPPIADLVEEAARLAGVSWDDDEDPQDPPYRPTAEDWEEEVLEEEYGPEELDALSTSLPDLPDDSPLLEDLEDFLGASTTPTSHLSPDLAELVTAMADIPDEATSSFDETSFDPDLTLAKLFPAQDEDPAPSVEPEEALELLVDPALLAELERLVPL